MTRSIAASLALALCSCGAGDDIADGTRAECAHGGALNDCPDAERTPEAACWRMVDCGAFPVKNDKDDNQFDWGVCVNYIESRVSTGQTLIIDCIAASSCDQLQHVNNRFDPQNYCLDLGGGSAL